MKILIVGEKIKGLVNESIIRSGLSVVKDIVGGENEVDLFLGGEAGEVPRGVSKVLTGRPGEKFEHHLAEAYEEALRGRLGEYAYVIMGNNSNGKNVIPRLAGACDTMPVIDVTKVVDAQTFERPIYAGNAVATVRVAPKPGTPVFLTFRTSSFAPASDDAVSVASEDVPLDAALPSQFVAEDLTTSERPELAGAKRVVSGGRALKSKENFALIEQVADSINAAVGASRAAVDAGYAPNDWQVGQTGKVVAPELYMAFGISGQIQHLAGMKDSKCIVAINTDPDAPITNVADYYLQQDLFTTIPEFLQKVDG